MDLCDARDDFELLDEAPLGRIIGAGTDGSPVDVRAIGGCRRKLSDQSPGSPLAHHDHPVVSRCPRGSRKALTSTAGSIDARPTGDAACCAGTVADQSYAEQAVIPESTPATC
jgi:hypothetical protein